MSSPSTRIVVALALAVLLVATWPGFVQESTGTAETDVLMTDVTKSPSGDCMAGIGHGATLLIPYFEVDLDSGDPTTLIAFGSSANRPTLSRVVLWTDWSIPTLAFDVYLDPNDIVSLNLRDVFNGSLPSTGESADLSGFDFCSSLQPFHTNPVIGPGDLDRISAMHTGTMDPVSKTCAGENHGDNVARGYLTIDVVDECSGVEAVDPVFTPANADYPYFAENNDGPGIALDWNVLWGDVFFVDNTNNFAQATEAVAIWADPSRFRHSNTYTFYGRYSNWDGRDGRVPLPVEWKLRILDGGPFAGGASIIVWRDNNSSDIYPVTCETRPSWWPFFASIIVYDEDGNSQPFTADNYCFSLTTQKTILNGLNWPISFGSAKVNFEVNQAWMQTSLAAFGRYSASFNGAPKHFLCDERPPPVQ